MTGKENYFKPTVPAILIAAIIVMIGSFRGFRASAQVREVPIVDREKIQPYDQTVRRASDESGFKWPEGNKAGVSLTFDDARLSQADKGIPLLDKYGVKATFYVSPGNMLKRVEVWTSAAKNGHDIGNHSLVHPCTGNFGWSRSRALENYTLEKMRAELDSAGRLIKETLGVEAVSFAYPCGQKFTGRGTTLKSYIPVVASMFESGRGWLDEGPNDPAFCDMAQLTGMELDNKSFEEILALIESARKNGQWLILAGHEMDETGKRQTSFLSTLEAICKYAADPANGIWLDNVHNIASYVREQRGKPFSRLPVYKDPLYTAEQRVEYLLSRMTLEEKIGQMNMPCVYIRQMGRDVDEKIEACRQLTAGTRIEGIGPGGGFFTLPNNILFEGPRQQAEFHNELQRIAVEKTRLGIPLLITEEGTHGLMCSGGTIFPEGLAIGSTWNTDLVEDIYSAAASEARAIGVHQLFTLVVEPNRDPRLGRNEEGYSEDPFLCSRIAEAIVEGIQGDDISAVDKVVAGLCHYPGQSEPVSGLERGAMEISERKLREVFLPPWEAGIRKKGALGVMATYPAIDGIAAHSSYKILTEILREELGFEGLVLGEGGGISTIVNENMAVTQKEAGVITLNAGLDVGISYEDGYMLPMIENVKEGKVDMALIDRAVRRILHQKIRLGLFERPWSDPDYAVSVSNTEENKQLALQTAREGTVLLKNQGNILPLDRNSIKSIAVIGPNADNELNQLGDYTSRVILQDIVTVLDGIKEKVSPDTRVTYVKGCEIISDELNEIARAKSAAKKADVAIVVVGESQSGRKTNGEGYDVASLDLTGMQEELIKAVHSTGTPVIVVLINGRPLSVRWAEENIPAILMAWNCGEQGGHAVADIIFGDYNPDGRLPITVPRHSGQLPVYYNMMPSKAYWIDKGWGTAYADMPATPLWEFGYGLSYTTFEYSNLVISPSETGTGGEVSVSVDVQNTGDREGSEVVQLYINDVISSVSTPVIELKGFKKVNLKAGEKKTINFKLTPEDLSLIDENLKRIVEPGTFSVMVGSSSKNIHLTGEFIIK